MKLATRGFGAVGARRGAYAADAFWFMGRMWPSPCPRGMSHGPK